jgi:hypothetical protein
LDLFLPFYAISLAVAPAAGWAAFSRRWAGSWAIPVTSLAVLALAAAYYFRDGMGYGMAGWVPGRRFLLPVAVLACLPAARFLASRFQDAGSRLRAAACCAAVVMFCTGFAALSLAHQNYLDAQAALQSIVRGEVPAGARVLVSDHAFKAFAPVNGRWTLRLVREGRIPASGEEPTAYRVWMGAPDQRPHAAWFAGGVPQAFSVSSWIWKRDVWVAAP